MRCLNLANATSGVLFSYTSIIFDMFYFCESKEPRETRVIKLSQKFSILQYSYTKWVLPCNESERDFRMFEKDCPTHLTTEESNA